jgi:hypothetical protein
MFTSIPRNLEISTMAVCELGPEHFLCPEMFENVNKIEIPGRGDIPMEFPKWASDADAFVELHRYALESFPIRSRIHSWIDLTFGVKSSGSEAEKALNIFNPLGYRFLERTPEEEALRTEWIRMSGQCPQQIFWEPFPEFKHVQEASGIEIVLGKRYETECNESEMSRRKLLGVATYVYSGVSIYHVSAGKVDMNRRQALFLRRDTRFSVVNDNQFVCATVCAEEVVVWCVINLVVLFVIEIEGVQFLLFDQEMNMMYMATENRLLQYSLTGKRLRELEIVEGAITAMAMFEVEFTFDHRWVLLGKKDGSVQICASEFGSRQLATLQNCKFSEFPIVRIVVRRGSHVVEVFDSASVWQVPLSSTVYF